MTFFTDSYLYTAKFKATPLHLKHEKLIHFSEIAVYVI